MMHSATSSGRVGLVRTVVPCAQTWVVIEMHSRTGDTKRHVFEKQATKPQAKREVRWTVFLWSKNIAIAGVLYILAKLAICCRVLHFGY